VTFRDAAELVVRGFEAAGLLILTLGSLRALFVAVRSWSRGERAGLYKTVRIQVGQAILLGLEVLIIADIVKTVTIDPTLENVATLGLLVLVRTFLSFSLEIELEGVVPWHRRRAHREESDPTPDL
jgi:uncharacterized membrane protein